MKEYAREFYLSKAWRNTRDAYLKSVGGLCEDCLEKGIYNAAEEVHHVKFITPGNINDPSVTLAWSNLRALCRECHRRRHTKKNLRYKVDEFGRVSPYQD